MTNPLLKLIGKYSAWTGKNYNWSDEHKKFLSSGYVCQNCGDTLMNWWGAVDVKCYSADDQVIPLISAGVSGKFIECNKCKHRWEIRAIQQ